MYFCLSFIDIWWSSDCTLFKKDGIICKGNFIYTKISKHFELISFLFGSHTLKKEQNKRTKGIIVCNFCYHIFIVISFPLQPSLERDPFEILKNSLHRELCWRKNFVKYWCSISFGLQDTDIDAHDFYKWAKKEEEIVQSSFSFSQLMIMKDLSPFY